MKFLKPFAILLFTLLSACNNNDAAAPKQPATAAVAQFANSDSLPKILMQTSLGDIEIALDPNRAPATVENFLHYVNSGFFEGTIFHRVIKDFMIQGGGFTTDYQKKDTREPVQNEANNGLRNEKYTIAMARTSDPHSATAQFFINTKNNDFLNHTNPSYRGWGYAVFGVVTKGFEVVDQIESVATGAGGPFNKDAPQQQVVIKSVQVLQ